MSACYVCGSAALAAADPRSPTCEACQPARDHVVSMQTGAGGSSIAICRCGWRSEVAWSHRGVVQDVKVRMHWRAMIRAAIDAHPVAMRVILFLAAPNAALAIVAVTGGGWS